MKKASALILTVAFTLLTIGFANANEDVTMEGKFNWNRKGDKQFDVKAVLTPDGKDKWAASFYFKWGKKDHVYVGTAEGNPVDGKLSGSVRNDNGKGKRTFTFTGTTVEGKFEGTHAETTKNTKDTGKIAMETIVVKK